MSDVTRDCPSKSGLLLPVQNFRDSFFSYDCTNRLLLDIAMFEEAISMGALLGKVVK
jgi:hypothetical protein